MKMIHISEARQNIQLNTDGQKESSIFKSGVVPDLFILILSNLRNDIHTMRLSTVLSINERILVK